MINSAEIATDLLNRKGSIYSDRPHMHFLNETIGWRDSFVMMNDGPELKEQRRLFAQAIGTKTALERFAPILDAQTSIFIQRILADPATLLRYIWV
jgi:cytochrome P450